MRLIVSFTALLLSVALMQLSSGGVGPLDVLSGTALGFTTAEIGLLGSSHFIGFFIGCWWAPRLMGSIGHSRAFAAFTATGAIGLLAHMLVTDPNAWAVMRIASGICVAGCYTVIEAWIQSKVSNDNRGRMIGVYRSVDISASFFAQMAISVLAPASYVSYNLLAIVCCAALLPLTLTTVRQPETPRAPRLRPALAFTLSPLAAVACIVAGLTSAAFRMVGPIYGQEVGLAAREIGFFLAAFVAGGAFSQWPLGWLADRFDRRYVLIALSAAAIGASAVTVAAATAGTPAVMTASALFGFTTSPPYSVATAHAHDFAVDTERVELSAALMFFFALGAIAAPLTASWLIEAYGPRALFAYIGVGHAALIVYSVVRMSRRSAPTDRTRYVYAPRTTFTVGRLMGRLRER